MSRERTGALEPAGKWPNGSPRFRFRLRLGDGSKSPRFDVPEGLDEKGARTFIAGMQAQEDARGELLAAKLRAADDKARELGAIEGESANVWFARYAPTIDCGENHRRIVKAIWSKWVSPVLGSKCMRTLTRDDVEDVRDALDRAVDSETIRHTTARNAWSVVTGAFKAACSSRDRTLRVHTAPLTYQVLPPKRGESRQRPWLYPNEWRELAACADVPIEWRQTYAIALYTGLRPNELRALTWADVDAKGKQINVSKAYDAQSKTVKAPKTTAGQRTVPIEPELAPLLEVLRGDDGALVVPLMSDGEDHLAQRFRDDLKLAGVTRARLVADNATEEPIDFRGLRDSCATHWALAGVNDKRIQRRLGHASNLTTDRYIKAAESFDVDAIGEPFPALPKELLVQVRPSDRVKRRAIKRLLVARVGFEAGKAATSAPDSPPINDLAKMKREDRSRSGVENGGFGPVIGPTPQPTRHPTRVDNAPAVTAAKLTLEDARVKLDAAIAAEAWDAVKVIAARVRELERADVVDLALERMRRK